MALRCLFCLCSRKIALTAFLLTSLTLAAQEWMVVDTFAGGSPQGDWTFSGGFSREVRSSAVGHFLFTTSASGNSERGYVILPQTVSSGKVTVAFDFFAPPGQSVNEVGFGAGSAAMVERLGWAGVGGSNRFQMVDRPGATEFSERIPQILVKAGAWTIDLIDPTIQGVWYNIWIVYDLDTGQFSLYSRRADAESEDAVLRGTWSFIGPTVAEDYAEISRFAVGAGGSGNPDAPALGGQYANIYMSIGENLTLSPTALVLDPPTWQAIETFAGGMPGATWMGDLDKFNLDFSEGFLHMLPTATTNRHAIWTALPQNMTSGRFTVTFDFFLNGPSHLRTDASFAVVGENQIAAGGWDRRGGTTRLGTFGAPPQAFRAFFPSNVMAIPGTETQGQWYHAWIHYDLAQQRIDFYYAPFGSTPDNVSPVASWPFDPTVNYENFRYFVTGFDRADNAGLRIGNIYFAPTELLTLSPTAGVFEAFVGAFAAQPVDTAAIVGSTAQLSAELIDPSVWSLRWEVSFDSGGSFADIAESATFSGTSTTTLTIHDVSTLLDGLVFRLKATEDGVSRFSDAAVLTVVSAPPVITFSTGDRVVPSGDTLVLAANIDGGPTVTMRWQRSVNDGGPFEDLPDAPPFFGVFGPSLTIDPVSMELDGHVFRVVASNEAGTTTSGGARITVLPPPAAPIILAQPEDRSVRHDHPATFEIAIEANPPATIRWQISLDGGLSFSDLGENALGIFTGTNTSLLVVNPASSFVDGIRLRARVQNDLGIVLTDDAQLSLRAHPTLAEWTAEIGLPSEASAPNQRHGPLGITTIEAFAFGLHPEEAAVLDLPSLHRADGELRLQYRRHVAVHGLSFLIKTSANLTAWGVAEVEDRLLYHANENVEVREAVFADDGEDRFLRLRLEVNE